jgi:hypothetical protein
MPFEVPARIGKAMPEPARVARIRERIMAGASAVRPLPSIAAMTALGLAAFIVLGIGLAWPFGYYGFDRLNGTSGMAEYAAVLLVAAALMAGALGQAIPGSRRIVGPAALVVIGIALLCLTTAGLFPDFGLDGFVTRGVPCLRLGLVCAVPAAALVTVAMQRGFVTDRVSAGLTGGALAGLAGVGVLALHCPVLNAAHIIAWHVGAVAVASLAGAVTGRAVSRFG